MSKYVCTSVDNLESLKIDCTGKLIRDIWKTTNYDDLAKLYPELFNIERKYYNHPGMRHIKREIIAHVAGYIGVEYLGKCRRTGKSVYYCNAGDTYTPTIVFKGNRLFISYWGYFIENNLVKPYNYF